MRKSVYIVLTSTGTALSQMIKSYTKEKYNHVSISLNEELTEMYSFGRRNPINPLDGGFVKEDVEIGTYSWFPHTECKILRLEVSLQEYGKITRFIDTFKKKQKKYVYNFVGLFGVVFNTPLEIEGAYFCSQFVAEILRRSGIQLFEKPSSLVQPAEFLELDIFDPLYEGKLYEYGPVKARMARDLEEYTHFPFRQYMYQKVSKQILKEINDDHNLSFRNGFLRPKKIYIDKQIKKITYKKE